LQGGLPFDNKYTFEICRKNVDNIMQIPEEQIEKSMAFGFRHERLVLEGSGAITMAPLLFMESKEFGENVAVVISGDNVNVDYLSEIVKKHE